jgi:hypothetical protein
LTVEETVRFAAALRLSRWHDKWELEGRIREVIKDLGLLHIRHSVIRPSAGSGISGAVVNPKPNVPNPKRRIESGFLKEAP